MSVLTTSGLAEHVHVPPATALLIKAIGFEHLHCRNLIYIYITGRHFIQRLPFALVWSSSFGLNSVPNLQSGASQ